MTTNKSFRRSNAPQETATECGLCRFVGYRVDGPTVCKYIALNHEWNITGNHAVLWYTYAVPFVKILYLTDIAQKLLSLCIYSYLCADLAISAQI